MNAIGERDMDVSKMWLEKINVWIMEPDDCTVSEMNDYA